MEIKTVTQLVRLLGSVLLEGLVGLGHMARFVLFHRAERARIRGLMVESSAQYLAHGILEAPAGDDDARVGSEARPHGSGKLSSPEEDAFLRGVDDITGCSASPSSRIPAGAGAGIVGAGFVLCVILSLLAAGLLLEGCAASPLEQTRVRSNGPIPGTSFERQIEEFEDSARVLADMSDAQGSLEDDLRAFGSGTSVSEAADDLETLLLDPDAQQSMEDDLREFGKSDPESFWETLRMLGW